MDRGHQQFRPHPVAIAGAIKPTTARTIIGRARRGFTFTEVMFAVIILGVGFVMIAAILPVAIQMSKSNVDEATASAVAQSAVSAITNLPNAIPAAAPVGAVIPPPPAALFPPTTAAIGKGRLYSFGEADPTTFAAANPQATGNYFTPAEQINALIGSMIFKSDPRFAWIGFYQRDMVAAGTPASYAKLTILTIQSRLRPFYTLDYTEPAGCDFPYSPVPPPVAGTVTRVDAAHPLVGTFRPKTVYVYLTERIDQPDLLTFVASAGGPPINEPRAGEGAFVIIADSSLSDASATIPTTTGRAKGDLNGKVYRLGPQSADFPGRWELQAGYDMTYHRPPPAPASQVVYNENVPYSTIDPTMAQVPPTSGVPATAYIVGRGLSGPASPPSSSSGAALNGSIPEDDDQNATPAGNGTNVPGGAVQDVSVFQCIVPIPQ